MGYGKSFKKNPILKNNGGGLKTLAYVLARVEAGKDREVFNEIKKLVEIKKASATYGIYDLHLEWGVETVDELDARVFDRVRRIPRIKETVTMIASETLVEGGNKGI